MAKEFPDSDPGSMYEVFKCSRRHEIAERRASGLQIVPRKFRETISNSEAKKIIIRSLNAETLKIQTVYGARPRRENRNTT